MKTQSRRQFLAALPASAALASLGSSPNACAIEPIDRPGPPRLRLSLAAYSFRQYFKHQRGGGTPADPAKTIDMLPFIDYCADQGCAGAELTSYYFPPDPDNTYLQSLKRQAFLRGIAISGTAVGNVFTLPVGDKRTREIEQVKQWIERAAAMGAPHIRIFAGNLPTGMSASQARILSVSAIEECCAEAARRGVFLGLENHGGIVAEPDALLDIVRAVRSPWFGINLDTGNFQTDDPYADLERCLPYAVNVQVKVEIQRRGKAKEPADYARIGRLLRAGRYQGFVALEYEGAEDPWTAVPVALDRLREALV